MTKRTVIVADDEGIIAMDVAEILEEAGYLVVGIAKDGVEAYELGRTKRPDLFVLDIQMPRMDGIQTARRIAADGLGPVMLLTAFAEDELVAKASESGVYGYLLKPVDETALKITAQIALQRYADHEKIRAAKQLAETTLTERKTVERAKGLLMQRYGVSEEEAYRKMRTMAMNRGCKMTVMATRIIRELTSEK